MTTPKILLFLWIAFLLFRRKRETVTTEYICGIDEACSFPVDAEFEELIAKSFVKL